MTLVTAIEVSVLLGGLVVFMLGAFADMLRGRMPGPVALCGAFTVGVGVLMIMLSTMIGYWAGEI